MDNTANQTAVVSVMLHKTVTLINFYFQSQLLCISICHTFHCVHILLNYMAPGWWSEPENFGIQVKCSNFLLGFLFVKPIGILLFSCNREVISLNFLFGFLFVRLVGIFLFSCNRELLSLYSRRMQRCRRMVRYKGVCMEWVELKRRIRLEGTYVCLPSFTFYIDILIEH